MDCGGGNRQAENRWHYRATNGDTSVFGEIIGEIEQPYENIGLAIEDVRIEDIEVVQESTEGAVLGAENQGFKYGWIVLIGVIVVISAFSWWLTRRAHSIDKT